MTSEKVVPCRVQSCDAAYYNKRIAVIEKGIYNEIPPKCAAGYYGNSTVGLNQTNILCSGACPAGRICPHAGTVQPLPVPPGYYTPAEGSKTSQPCPLGHYCAGNTSEPIRCPAGTLGDATGLNSSSCSRLCPEGYYCEAGSAAAVVCEDGTYGDRTSLTSQGECRACPDGHWCNSGKAFACDKGEYAVGSERTNLNACKRCSDAKPHTTTLQEATPSKALCVCEIRLLCH